MRNLAVMLGCVVVLSVVSAHQPSQAPPPQISRAFEAFQKAPRKLKILFLGHKPPHHAPSLRYKQIEPVLAARGIEVIYTDSPDALNPKTLSGYDGLIIYANIDKITPDQEKSLLDYVASGKGFIPLHCASFCFQNSPKYIELVGAQFKSHQTGTFRTVLANVDHPILKGFDGFESWDETYVHAKHNEKDRTVLEYRVDKKGKEPWTWVRTHGKGRVFYTAWGHDERTWGHPGFQNLVERGIRWAVGDDLSQVPDYTEPPKMTALRKDVKPFEYGEGKVPIYTPKSGVKSSNQVQKPLDAEESAKHMVFPEQFDLELYASDPLIKRPICMNWDERGRLWIAETVDYPNSRKKQPGEGNDRILILEDTKGTGKADKITVFADKLSIPASMMFANGGVIIHQIPKTLFLKSSKGDDHADIRTELITTWGTNDTHAGPSNLRYGLDNWYYGIVGYAGLKATTIGGESIPGRGQTFYRFKANEEKATKFEYVRSTNNNSWGVGFSEEGLLFGSTANGNPSVYVPIANRYYEQVRGLIPETKKKGGAFNGAVSIAGNPLFHPIVPPEKVRQVDFHGRFTAAAGHALYTARLYPHAYWNRTAFVAEPTGHLLATFLLEKKGTEVTSKPAWNLLASDDEWTSPIMAEVGPDGCVWIIDWYNFIVQHNPTPPGFPTGPGAAYETPLRDKSHGRIYRLVPKNAKLPAPISLKDATPQKLVETLANDNMFWRMHAQRLLVERGKQDVLPALVKLIADPSVDGIGLNPGAIHALWTMHGLKALDGSNRDANVAAVGALSHPSAGVRRNAALVLPQTADSVERLLLKGSLNDPDAQVRLAALLALSEMPPNPRAGSAIVEMIVQPENYRDRWIVDAACMAGARHDVHFLKAVAAGKHTHTDRTLRVVAVVAEHHARGGKADAINELVLAFADADPKVAEEVVARFAKYWPKSVKATLTEPGEKALAKLLSRLSPAGQGNVVQIASVWGVKGLEKHMAEITTTLFAIVANEKDGDEKRLAAAKQLLDWRGSEPGTIDKLLAMVTPQASPDLSVGVFDLLGSSASTDVGKAVAKRLPTLSPAARLAALRVLMTRPERTMELLDALKDGGVQIGELTPDQKQALASHTNKDIATRAKEILTKFGSLADPDREKAVKELMQLLAKTGDAKVGKAVFTKHCATCHMHSGEGNKVGPDLTGMAVHPKEHLLIDIIDPSRNVEGNFRLYNVTLNNGIVMSGMVASESKTTVELIDAQGKKHQLLREDIDKLVATSKSLMPDGFEKTLTKAELVDVLEFLTARGQFFAVPLAKLATVITTKGMFTSLDAEGERMVFADWGPKTFKGVPFQLIDPKGDTTPNAIMLNGGPKGTLPNKMPKSVKFPLNAPAKAIHMLSGVSGWGYPYGKKKDVVLIVRLHYADGKIEDHPLINGTHFADYISRQDVPGSEFAFAMRGQQLRYLAVSPKRDEAIAEIEFVKGPDQSAPIIMAVTVEAR